MENRTQFLRSVFFSANFAVLAVGLTHADNRVNSGAFASTAAGTSAGYTLAGTAVMARSGDTVTYITTHVTGLKPNATYGSHVHILPCSMGGGGHYKKDPSIDSMVASNELWPTLKTDSTGTASAFISVSLKVRPEGQSIVIHDTTAGKEKIGCADLLESVTGAVTTSGNFQRFPDTTTTLAGSASMIRAGDSTVVSVSVTGLLPNMAYGCHVHNLPGAVQKGGAHYQIDPTITVASEANEIWLNFTTDEWGNATKTVTSHFKARPEAQTIVVHAPGGTRIGWVDLLPPAGTGLASSAIIAGPLATTAVGTTAGYTAIAGKGLIVRGNNMTVATLSVTGLVPNKAYGSHVHSLPCAQTAGGGHYKIDTTIATAVESNEIWTLLKTDATGAATGFGLAANHLARPTAQSIVIHDTVTAARVACIDLAYPTTSIGAIPLASTESKVLIDLGFNHFRVPAQGDFSIGLYNLQGKRVFSRSGSGSQILDLGGMTRGHYFSKIIFQNRSETAIKSEIFVK